MNNKKHPKKAWAVVEVMSGIPSGVKIFRYKQSAIKHEKILRKHMNLDNDETGVFLVNV